MRATRWPLPFAVASLIAVGAACGSESKPASPGASGEVPADGGVGSSSGVGGSSGASSGSSSSGSVAPPETPFPASFHFGTAIAGFQVEMGCPTLPAAECEDRGSDWYQWITTDRILNNPVLFMSKDPPSSGPGFFETYRDDIRLAGGSGDGELRTDTLRLSFEWSRIFPNPTFGLEGEALRQAADPAALAYYHDVLAALRERGMRASVTVTHYSLPLWIHDGALCNEDMAECFRQQKGGWGQPERGRIVNEIAKYAGFLGREFGAEVDEWATENEPFSAVVVPGYLVATPMRTNPPGRSAAWMHVSAAKTATLALIEAHAKMYDALKANDTVDADGDGDAAQVGIVYAFSRIDPLTGNANDARAAADAEYFFHGLFMDGVTKGRVDPDWTLGAGNGQYRPDLDHRLDWIGVNFYFRFPAQYTQISTLPFISPLITFNLTQSFDDQCPGCLEQVLQRVSAYGKPMVVSETGYSGGGRKQSAWLVDTLGTVQRAIGQGLDVRGFYAWSLMDNYEWNHGMDMRFGLLSVDPHDKARAVRDAGRVFRQIIDAREVTQELQNQHLGAFPSPPPVP